MEDLTYKTFTGVEYTNEYDLDETFLTNYYNWSRKDFLLYYKDIYKYITETQLTEDYVDGFIYMKGKEYYVVPSKTERWDYSNKDGKGVYIKVGRLDWDEYLLKDGRCILKLNQGMSKEHFIYSMMSYTSKNYDDLDMMDETWFIDRCIDIWNSYQENDYVSKKEMTFKIKMSYWRERGYNNPLVVCSIIKRKLKNDTFSKYYNEKLTIEENVIRMKEQGVITKNTTLKKWCIDNGIVYTTNAEKKRMERNSVIIDVYNEDNKRSSRIIEKLVNEKGYSVSYRTIQEVIEEYQTKNRFNSYISDFIIEEVREPKIKYNQIKDVFTTERSGVENTLIERSLREKVGYVS